ncbi:MAG TPA: EamA family transporter [Terriglobia bacterium]|jgi:drug/metabolite transporter (DMT)-like permease|nr:EamA family transporter [Terriglobia bacterium]
MRTALFLTLVVLGTSGGELSVSRAMKQLGELQHFSPRSLVNFLGRALRVKWFWTGIALLALGFFSLLALLTWADVSFVIPAAAASYVAGALGAKFLLGERLTPLRWAGIVLVAAGVAVVSIS